MLTPAPLVQHSKTSLTIQLAMALSAVTQINQSCDFHRRGTVATMMSRGLGGYTRSPFQDPAHTASSLPTSSYLSGEVV